MNYVLDIVLTAIFVITFVILVNKGFVKVITGFTSFIGAFVLTKLFSPALSKLLYMLMYNNFSEQMKESISLLGNDYIEKNTSDGSFITTILEKYNINGIVEKTAENAAEYMVSGIITLLSRVIAFILLFVLSLVVIYILSKIIIIIFKLPLLKEINTFLGVVLGLLLGLLYAFLFVGSVQLFIPLIQQINPELITNEVIEKTYIFKYFYNLTWLKFFILF